MVHVPANLDCFRRITVRSTITHSAAHLCDSMDSLYARTDWLMLVRAYCCTIFHLPFSSSLTS